MTSTAGHTPHPQPAATVLTLDRATQAIDRMHQLLPDNIAKNENYCEIRAFVLHKELERLGFTPTILQADKLPPFEWMGTKIHWLCHRVPTFDAQDHTGIQNRYVIDTFLFPDGPVTQAEWEGKMRALGASQIAVDHGRMERWERNIAGGDHYRQLIPAVFEAYGYDAKLSMAATDVQASPATIDNATATRLKQQGIDPPDPSQAK